MHCHELFGLIANQRTICQLIGDALFIYAFWIIAVPHLQKEQTDVPSRWNNWKAATFTISGLGFLVVSRFIYLNPRMHSMLGVLGWLQLFVSFTLPKSNWQPAAFFTLYALVLSQVPWKRFSLFSGMEIRTLIALLVLWFAMSGAIYLFLIRRKPATSPLI